MSPTILALLLAAALIHAGWNALVRGAADRLWSIAVIALAGALVAFPIALFLPAPAAASWPYLLLSAVVQIGYCLFLVRAYEHGELASVYPVARGSAPVLVTIGAAILASELPTVGGLIGIALVSAGILTLVVGSGLGRAQRGAILLALATGGFIAAYTVIDGLGVRVAGSAAGYAAWQASVAGLLISFAYVVIRRRLPPLPRGRSGMTTVTAGALSALAYAIAVWAMDSTAMGEVSAVRETSILFAALIGHVALGERLTARKLIGAAAIAGGVICLAAG